MLIRTQSVYILQCCLSVFYFFTAFNLAHVVCDDVPRFLVDDEAAGVKFWTLFGMVHKLLDDKVAAYTVLGRLDKEEVKRAPLVLTGESYSLIKSASMITFMSTLEPQAET